MSIIVKHITKYYGNQKALNDVTFEVNPGEIAGFIGPNGAGKSTLMKIITGYLPPNKGSVKVNGIDVSENSIEIKKSIGYLPEHNPLYLDMYIKEYLHYVAGLYKLGKRSRQVMEKVILETGLTPELHKKIGALSKGYRQRVGLAQAIIHDPPILILDEPTSGLDPNQIIEIRELISNLGKEKTVLLSTHIMQEVEAICDKIIIINKGELKADGTTNEVIKQSKVSTQTIVVEFNAPIDIEKLKTIQHVERVLILSDRTYLLECSEEHDIRENVFNFAVANRLSVLSMQKKEKRLEEVFQELTR